MDTPAAGDAADVAVGGRRRGIPLAQFAKGDVAGAASAIGEGVLDTAGAAVGGVADTAAAVGGVADTAGAAAAGALDTLSVASDHAAKIANRVRNCVDDLEDCALLNPLWGALPSCLLEAKPHLCFHEPAELLGRYAARFQKIAAMGFYEVGEALLDLAKDFGKRRFADCSDGARVTNEMGFLWAPATPKRLRSRIDTLARRMPDAGSSRRLRLVSDCFMKSARLLPQVGDMERRRNRRLLNVRARDHRGYNAVNCSPRG